MGFELLRGGLSDDQIEVHFDAGQAAALDAELDGVAQNVSGFAWFIEDDGSLLAKGGGPPSDLTFEIRKLAVELGWQFEGVDARPARAGTSLRQLPPTRSIAVPPKGILIASPGRESGLEPLLRESSTRLARILEQAIWIVPPPERI